MILLINLLTNFINFLSVPKFTYRNLIILYLILESIWLLTLNISHLSIFEGILVLNTLHIELINYIIILFILFLYLNFSNLKFEKLLIILANFYGILTLILSNDFLLIFINIELINLSLYLLIANYSSGIKYFILSSIFSTILLFGIILLYNSVGNLHLDVILSFLLLNSSTSFNLGLLLILTTIFFKLGLFPFHQWSPDLYSGIHFIYMIYIQIFIKYGILILLFKLNSLFYHLINFIFFISFFTIIVTTLLLNSQYLLQRFIALSSISHLGFLVLQFSYSYLFYIYIYNISSLILFFLLSSYHLSSSSSGFLLSIIFFSLSGLPPLPGFFTKFYILIDLMLLNYTPFVILMLLSSIILSANYINLALIILKSSLSKYSIPLPHSSIYAIFFSLFISLPILF